MALATRYDEVPYPSVVFSQTSPERLAVLARLQGLSAPDLATARVLEIAGGDGLSLLAFAAKFPGAQCHNFDLSPTAIERGQAKIDAGGFANVTMAVRDIMTGRDHFAPGSFDYVIAHGIYAWVPDEVREEVMALIGHALSDDGVAFVSFNAMPGGHVRLILRDMLTYVLQGVDDPHERITAMRTFLTEFATEQEDDSPLMTAMRAQAQVMMSGNMQVVWHDELGPFYAPQQLSAVVDAADAAGLTFLTDAGRNLNLNGFLSAEDGVLVKGDALPEGIDPDAQVVKAAQLDDFLSMRFFRQPTFVRKGRKPLRVIDTDQLRGLHISTTMKHRDGAEFVDGKNTIEIHDTHLADAIKRLAGIAPHRMPIEDLELSHDHLIAVLRLSSETYVRLWSEPAPFVEAPGEYPKVSALIRAQFALGETKINGLDYSVLQIDQPEMHRLLLAADGTRTMDELAAMPDLGPLTGEVPQVLAAAARRAFLVA